MPAMHKDVRDCMVRNLEAMTNRMISIIPFDMTHEECLHLVADPEHVPILLDAAKYADVKSSVAWMVLGVPMATGAHIVSLCMTIAEDREPPLRPRHAYWHPGTRGAHKVIDWLTKRLELGRRIALANWTLRSLYDLCDIGSQMRYAWPVCMHLLKTTGEGDERVRRWAEKHGAYKPQRYMPVLSPALRAAIQDSCALITSAALLGEDDAPTPPKEVHIMVGQMPKFDHFGVTFDRE